MRLRALLALVTPFVLLSCSDPTVPSGPPIDCNTLAATYLNEDATFTTTPSGLKYRDVTVGTGTTYATGNIVSVRYAGCTSTGLRFDSNEAPAPTFQFQIGKAYVIKGWDEGIPGMKVGGRRQLIVPPSLGYGALANGPIPANSTLAFTVDAISTP